MRCSFFSWSLKHQPLRMWYNKTSHMRVKTNGSRPRLFDGYSFQKPGYTRWTSGIWGTSKHANFSWTVAVDLDHSIACKKMTNNYNQNADESNPCLRISAFLVCLPQVPQHIQNQSKQIQTWTNQAFKPNPLKNTARTTPPVHLQDPLQEVWGIHKGGLGSCFSFFFVSLAWDGARLTILIISFITKYLYPNVPLTEDISLPSSQHIFGSARSQFLRRWWLWPQKGSVAALRKDQNSRTQITNHKRNTMHKSKNFKSLKRYQRITVNKT